MADSWTFGPEFMEYWGEDLANKDKANQYDGQYDTQINQSFQNLFGRDAADEGRNYWGSSLADPNSGITLENLDQSLINGASEADLTYYNANKASDGGTSPDDLQGYINELIGENARRWDLERQDFLDSQQAQTDQQEQNLVDLFQPDLYPESGSASTSKSVGNSQSSSGIDFDNPFIQKLISQIEESTSDLPGNIDKMTQGAADTAEAVARKQAKEYLPQALNTLVGKGVLNSTVAKDSISSLLSSISENAAQTNYDASIEGAKMKQDIPALLAQLAELGRKSSTSSTTTSNSDSSSHNTDKLAPYELVQSLILGGM